MPEPKDNSFHAKTERMIQWLDNKIAFLEELKNEFNIAVGGHIYELDDAASKTKVFNKSIQKYIEIKHKIEFCHELKKEVKKEYDDFLVSQATESFIEKSTRQLDFELDTIPDPRLWEE